MAEIFWSFSAIEQRRFGFRQFDVRFYVRSRDLDGYWKFGPHLFCIGSRPARLSATGRTMEKSGGIKGKNAVKLTINFVLEWVGGTQNFVSVPPRVSYVDGVWDRPVATTPPPSGILTEIFLKFKHQKHEALHAYQG